MNDDGQLLGRYAREADEEAFAEVVRRHLDAVYSTAARLVGGDRHLAEDVSQAVFLDLARKAGSLVGHPCLVAWLHQAARFAATKAVRRERRRSKREKEAAALDPAGSSEDKRLEDVEAVLDDAIASLGGTDRRAILMRFFERRDLKGVAEGLGTTEDAARKRLARAVERLRVQLVRREARVSSAVLAGGLLAATVRAAPLGIASKAKAAALQLAGSGPVTARLPDLLPIIMNSTRSKTALLLGSILLVAVAPFSIERATNAILWNENARLRRITEERDARAQRPGTKAEAREAAAATASARDRTDLLRLRGEVARLRRQLHDSATPAMEAGDAGGGGHGSLAVFNPYLERGQWSDKGTDTVNHALETFLFASSGGDHQRVEEVTMPGERPFTLRDHPPVARVKGVQIVSVDTLASGDLTRVGAVVEEEFHGAGLDKPPGTVQTVQVWFLVRTNGEWRTTGEPVAW